MVLIFNMSLHIFVSMVLICTPIPTTEAFSQNPTFLRNVADGFFPEGMPAAAPPSPEEATICRCDTPKRLSEISIARASDKAISISIETAKTFKESLDSDWCLDNFLIQDYK